MRKDWNGQRIDTTLGELIEAVSDAAFDYCESPREAHILAGLVISDLLNTSQIAPLSLPRPRDH